MTLAAMFSPPDLDIALLSTATLEDCKSLLVAIAKVEERGFIWRGIVLREIERRELWREGYTSMKDFLCHGSPYSARDGYAALAAAEELKDVPVVDLANMPRCNVETLKHLSSTVRSQPEVVEAAKSLSEDDFVAHIQEHHPTQRIEHRKRLIFRPTESQKSVIERVLTQIGTLLSIEDREGQLEALCADWEQEHQ